MIAERIIKIAEFLPGLEEKELVMGEWVSSYDEESECGTVCCVAGWFPKIFPNDFVWTDCGSTGKHTVLYKRNLIPDASTKWAGWIQYSDIAEFLGIPYHHVVILFTEDKGNPKMNTPAGRAKMFIQYVEQNYRG